MSLRTRIQKSALLSPQERLALGLLENETMTARDIISCCMSDPYNLDFDEISKALVGLEQKGLLAVHEFRPNDETMDIDIYLTFSPDWVFKL